MRREEAEHLIHHHYRLHTQVRSKIDTKPPISMFVSPKSTHYKPFAQRRYRSVEAKRNPRPKGGEELAQFISIRKIPSVSSISHNVYAKQSSLPNILPSTSSSQNLYAHVKPKLLADRNYQPPTRRARSPRKNSPASQSLNLPPTTSKVMAMLPPRSFSSLSGVKPRISNNPYRNYELVQRRYREFKEQCLSDILLRGVYSDRVIKDCFYREMERRTDLDYEHMEQIMVETLRELGISFDDPHTKQIPPNKNGQKTEKHVKIIKEKIRESTGSIEELDEENHSQAGSNHNRARSSASSSKTSSRSKTSSTASDKSESESVVSVNSSQLSTPPGGNSKNRKSSSSNGSTFSSLNNGSYAQQRLTINGKLTRCCLRSKDNHEESKPPAPNRQISTATTSSLNFQLDVIPPRLSSTSSEDLDGLIKDNFYPKVEGIDLFDKEPSLCNLENLDSSSISGGDSQLADIIKHAKSFQEIL